MHVPLSLTLLPFQKGQVDLQTPRVTLSVTGKNAQDMTEWIEAFKTVIGGQLANVKSLASKVDASRNTATMQALREASPANAVCADCSMPAPEWASVNLGILICIECSGYLLCFLDL